MKRRISINSSIIINIKFIFYIIIFIKFFVLCDNDPCQSCKKSNDASFNFNGIQNEYGNLGCPSECRYSITKDKWYRCSGISTSYYKYFIIVSDNAGENFHCEIKEYCNNTVVSQTKECILSCESIKILKTNFKQVGDFCIYNYNLNDEREYGITIGGLTIVECKSDYYKLNELIDNRKYFKCIDKKDCPTHYYDFDEKKCLSEPTCGDKKILKRGINFECRNECEYGEVNSNPEENNYIFEYNLVYCVQKCPEDALFYYEINNNNPRKCLPKCKDKEYYSCETNSGIKQYQCTSTSKNNKYIKEDSKNFYKCVNDCTSPYSYNYKNEICLKSCSDIQLIYKNIKTYSLVSGTNKQCVEDCGGKYSDEDSLSCVDDCGTTKFIENKKCVSSCSSGLYKVEGNKYECVNKCPNDFYLLGNACYKKCPEESGKPYADLSSKCTDCKFGSGYYKYNDNSQQKKCQPTCNFEGDSTETKYFYYSDSNICYEKGEKFKSCKDLPKNYPYYSSDNEYKCYRSCEEISPEHKFEDNYNCSKEFNCENYFYNYAGMTKCLNNTIYISKCSKIGYKYLRGKECVDKCNQNEYVVEPQQNIYEGITRLGECILDIESVKKTTYKYYSHSEKYLNQTCGYRRIDNARDDLIQTSSDGTCVKKCPYDYPYEATDADHGNKKICVKSCKYFFYEEDDSKICIDDCKSIGKYHFKDNNECIDECKKNNINYYYDSDDNTCYPSCLELVGKQFALEAKDRPEKCLQECPNYNKYYYDDKKICKKDCDGGYFKDTTSEICVEQCKGKFIYNNTICVEECRDDKPFYATLENNKKCYTNCLSAGEAYKFYDDKGECFTMCPSDTPYKLRNKCVEQCPPQYYVNGTKECISNCPTKYYKKRILNNNEDTYVFDCINDCEKYIIASSTPSTPSECVDYCPLGLNFIGENRQCKPKCEEFYSEFEIGNQNLNHKIYLCSKEIPSDHLHIFDTQKTIKADYCPEPYYTSKNEKKCYKKCINSTLYPFSTKKKVNGEDKKVCDSECLDENAINYNTEDKICVSGCSQFQYNKIINDENNSCVSQCEMESLFKYETIGDDEQRHCSKKCNVKEPRYTNLTNYYFCSKQCSSPYKFVLGNECLKKCPPGYFNEKNEEGEYICREKCDYKNSNKKYFYKENLECIDKCKTNDYVIQNTYECTSNCYNIGSSNYHSFVPNPEESNFSERTCVLKCPEEKKFLRPNNECHQYCESDTNNYYLPENYTCLEKCPKERKMLKVNDIHLNVFECVLNCPSPYFENSEKLCVNSCSEPEKYYNPIERKCLAKCNDTLYYTDGDKCVTSCGEKYLDNKECKEKCSFPRKYSQEEFTHGESDTQKKCLYKCPQDYPFVKIEGDGDASLSKCFGTCDHYINRTSSYESYECRESCEEPYNYYDIDTNGRFVCRESCSGKYYKDDKDDEGKYKCEDECPEDKYQKINSNECVEALDCNTPAVDYENKKCVYGCSNEQFWSLGKDGIKYCLKECNNRFGEYKTYGNQCIENCNKDNLVPIIISNSEKRCSCENLYIEDSNTGEITCLDKEITECQQDNSNQYKYRIFDNYITNQCSKNCFGLLSPNEDICYLSYTNCSNIPNTEISFSGNKIKCECAYRWYVENNKKVCLEKDRPCDVNPYLYEDILTKQCIRDCGSKYEYDYKCFDKSCPEGTTNQQGKMICTHDGYWYKTSDNDYKFLAKDIECPISYPYLIKETNECVKNCLNPKYSSIYKKICYSSCEVALSGNLLKAVEPEEGSTYYNKASYECQCSSYWYEDENGEMNCEIENSDKFKKKYPFIVKKTKQYVVTCPPDYSYYFNNECFTSCENAKKEYQINVKKKDNISKECICENLWRKKDNITICLKDVNCAQDELIVEETNECVKNCPSDFPLKFNGKCIKNCPENTEKNGLECKCQYSWYKQSNGNKLCLGNGEKCKLETHPLQIYSTKECITSNECPALGPDNEDKLKNFNYICYDKCPVGTIDEVNNNSCKCDSTYSYWAIEEDDIRPLIKCGKSICDGEKTMYTNDTRECVSKCSDGYYEFGNVCYKGGCPDPTVPQNAKTNKYKCVVRKYATATNLVDLNKYLKSEIIKLYEGAPDGGITYTNFNTTMQLYGIKKDEEENKTITQRSSLSYIDISLCKNKIYSNNKMQDKDDIIVVKYDLGNSTIKSFIKPVEYEFINSRTGQILDMSVCTKDDIVISYSLSYLLNYNKKTESRRLEGEESEPNSDSQEEDIKDDIIPIIQEQYNKGKQLYSIYHLDTFDINSILYTDMCYSLEIDGKDLVLEDRVNYLYPLYSLCEENCTYSHVDFDSDRIYCNCPLKTQLNLNREHKFVLNSYDNDYIKSKQKGPTNLPVMKCTSRLKEKDSINKNGAFFYSLIILILQFLLVFISIFYNYRNLKNKITKNSMKNGDEKEIVIETNENRHNETNHKTKNNNNEKIYKTSERALVNAPPKKREIDNNKIDINDIKLEEKYEITNEKNDVETDDPRLDVEDENDSFSKDYELGIFNEVQKEQKLLRIKFELAIQKDKSDPFIILLTEICDKIYIIKILCLLGKYDMPTMYYSAYLLYHLLLLTFVTCFYDIKTIQNIWNKEDYPDLNYDLGYGLLACIIVWVIYKIFLCILNNEDIIKKYLKKNINTSISSKNDDIKLNNKKLNNLLYKIKSGMVAFFIIEFIIGIVCLIYLTTFCAVYTGTKKKIFKTYGIALVEVLIIKIIYGILLGIFRKVGLAKQKKVLYNISYYLDSFLH